MPRCAGSFSVVVLTALLLAGCSWLPRAGPGGGEVVAQANTDSKISFDIVKIDDGVIKTIEAQGQPAFPDDFKRYTPPPEIKIGVGDTVSVVIWEAAANGLFGNSLTEWSVPYGAASRQYRAQTPGPGALTSAGESTTAFASESGLRLLGLQSASETADEPRGARLGLAGRTDEQGFTASGGVQRATSPEAAPATAALPGQESGGAATSGLSDLAPLQPTRTGAGPTAVASPNAPQKLLTPDLASANAEQLLQVTSSGRPGTRIPDQQVGPDGAISIPYAGRIAAADRTPAEVEHTIEQQLGPKALEPHAIVVIRRSVANSVAVEGEVVKGGRVPLSPGGERLLQVIAAAGGAGAPVHETFVQLSRRGRTVTLPLATLVQHPEEDIFAEPADVLTVIRRPQTFSAFGATGKNAAITFNTAKLSLAEALAKAGGLLDERADPRAVFLFRYEPAGIVRALGQPIATAAPEGVSPVVYRLDLADAKSFSLAQEFPVRDKDIIFVANAELADVYKVFAILQKVTGPVVTGFLTCNSAGC